MTVYSCTTDSGDKILVAAPTGMYAKIIAIQTTGKVISGNAIRVIGLKDITGNPRVIVLPGQSA